MPQDSPIQFPEKVRNAPRFDLLRTLITASIRAWQEAIAPRMVEVRHATIDAASHKKGTDFFTEADVASEGIIVDSLIKAHGEKAFRIFGEEVDAYTGNPDAEITIRIDPIDGTESFKFGKPTWSIMIGAYVGRGANEHQVASAVYWPEYYNEIMFVLEDAGVFKAGLGTRSVVEFPRVNHHDSLNELIIGYWKHSSHKERGRIDGIVGDLDLAGARLRTVTPADVKEALETGGRRAMVFDGDFTKVDFISFSALARLGYTVHGWDGTPRSIDDPALTNQKLVVVPPGRAGEAILAIVRRYA